MGVFNRGELVKKCEPLDNAGGFKCSAHDPKTGKVVGYAEVKVSPDGTAHLTGRSEGTTDAIEDICKFISSKVRFKKKGGEDAGGIRGI